jgi:hypothetical protein
MEKRNPNARVPRHATGTLCGNHRGCISLRDIASSVMIKSIPLQYDANLLIGAHSRKEPAYQIAPDYTKPYVARSMTVNGMTHFTTDCGPQCRSVRTSATARVAAVSHRLYRARISLRPWARGGSATHEGSAKNRGPVRYSLGAASRDSSRHRIDVNLPQIDERRGSSPYTRVRSPW